MDTDSLSYKTLKNIAYSFLGFVWPIVLSIITTRVVINRLGVVDYGVYLLVGTITGFMGLLDLGLTTAVVKYVSGYYAEENFSMLQKTLNAVFSLYLIVGAVGLAIFFVLGKFFLPYFHITGLSQTNILVVFILAGLIFFVRSVSTVYTVVPQALQRFDLVYKINLSQLTFFSFSMLAAALAGYKLKVILSLNLLSLLGLVLAYRFYTIKLLPKFKLGLGWGVEEIKKLYRFGLFAAVGSVATSSLDQMDRLIIPAFLGPAALSYYSIPGNVAQKTNQVVGSLGGVFFPFASSLTAGGDANRLRIAYKKVVGNLIVAAAAIATAIMCFGYQIIFYWLGKDGRDFADRGYGVLLILAVTYFILSMYAILINFLMGMGKIKFISYAAIVLAAMNLVLLFLLLPKFGIIGAAWAYLGGVLPVLGLICWAEKKYLDIPDSVVFYLKALAKIFVVSLIFFFLSKYLLLKLVFSMTTLILVGPASVLVYLVIYKLLGFFDSEDWKMFEAFFQKILLKVF